MGDVCVMFRALTTLSYFDFFSINNTFINFVLLFYCSIEFLFGVSVGETVME
jgi:hypothetical protein